MENEPQPSWQNRALRISGSVLGMAVVFGPQPAFSAENPESQSSTTQTEINPDVAPTPVQEADPITPPVEEPSPTTPAKPSPPKPKPVPPVLTPAPGPTAPKLRPDVVSHRGLIAGKRGHTENSLGAINQAAKLSLSKNVANKLKVVVEIDVWGTKRSGGQRVLVVNHNRRIGQTFRGKANPAIPKTTYKRLRNKYRMNNGQRIASLNEAMAVTARTKAGLQVEVKDKTLTVQELQAAMFTGIKSGLRDRLTFTSFSPVVLQRLKAARYYARAQTDIGLGFLTNSRNVSMTSVRNLVGANGYGYVLMGEKAASAASTNAAHRVGLKVGNWTLNTYAQRRAGELRKTDQVTTDYALNAIKEFSD